MSKSPSKYFNDRDLKKQQYLQAREDRLEARSQLPFVKLLPRLYIGSLQDGKDASHLVLQRNEITHFLVLSAHDEEENFNYGIHLFLNTRNDPSFDVLSPMLRVEAFLDDAREIGGAVILDSDGKSEGLAFFVGYMMLKGLSFDDAYKIMLRRDQSWKLNFGHQDQLEKYQSLDFVSQQNLSEKDFFDIFPELKPPRGRDIPPLELPPVLTTGDRRKHEYELLNERTAAKKKKDESKQEAGDQESKSTSVAFADESKPSGFEKSLTVDTMTESRRRNSIVVRAYDPVECHWHEYFDMNTMQMYYYNAETQETMWEKPQELVAYQESMMKPFKTAKAKTPKTVSFGPQAAAKPSAGDASLPNPSPSSKGEKPTKGSKKPMKASGSQQRGTKASYRKVMKKTGSNRRVVPEKPLSFPGSGASGSSSDDESDSGSGDSDSMFPVSEMEEKQRLKAELGSSRKGDAGWRATQGEMVGLEDEDSSRAKRIEVLKLKRQAMKTQKLKLSFKYLDKVADFIASTTGLPVSSVLFLKDGHHVLTTDMSGRAAIFMWETGGLLAKLRSGINENTHTEWALKSDADGIDRLFATVSFKGDAKIWVNPLLTGAIVTSGVSKMPVLQQHIPAAFNFRKDPGTKPLAYRCVDVSFSPNNEYFVVVAENGVLRLLGKATTVTKMPGLKLPVVQPLATSPVYVTLGVYRGLHFRFNSVGAPVIVPMTMARFTRDGKSLVTSGLDGAVHVFSTPYLKYQRSLSRFVRPSHFLRPHHADLYSHLKLSIPPKNPRPDDDSIPPGLGSRLAWEDGEEIGRWAGIQFSDLVEDKGAVVSCALFVPPHKRVGLGAGVDIKQKVRDELEFRKGKTELLMSPANADTPGGILPTKKKKKGHDYSGSGIKVAVGYIEGVVRVWDVEEGLRDWSAKVKTSGLVTEKARAEKKWKEQQAELKKARLKALGLDEKGKETPKADKAGGEGSGGGGGLKGGGKGRRASMLAIDGAQEAKAREMLEGSGGGAKGNRRGSIMADIAAAGRKKKGLNAAILNGSTAGDDDDDDEGEGEGDADTLPISGLAFSEDGRYLALSTATGYLQVKIGVEILGISFSPSCQHVAVGLSDGKVFVYEIKRKLVGAGSCCSVA